MYRLEIIADRKGLDADHIAWQAFRLVQCGQTPLTTTYTCTLKTPLNTMHEQIMQGWIEEGDIIAFVCEVPEA